MIELTDIGIKNYRDAFEASGAKVLKYREWEIHDYILWIAKVTYEGKTGWTYGLLSPHIHTPLTDLCGYDYNNEEQAVRFVKDEMEKHFLKKLTNTEIVYGDIVASLVGSVLYRKLRKMKKFIK